MVLVTRSLLFALFVAYGSAASTPTTYLCGRYDKYNGTSVPYTFSNNEWGADGSGSQCITVSNNDTVFSATWNWSNNATLVHSFPNINLNSPLLPLQLLNLSLLNVTATWSMTTSDGSSLTDVAASANVVVDMFLDPDPTRAKSTTLPQYEVMIWLAALSGRKPIGFNSSITSPPKLTVGGITFTLYSGPNNNGQMVYSWLAGSSTLTNFSADISPLLHFLWRHYYFAESNYLGIVQFGTETFHSTANVTFSATDYLMSIRYGTPSASSAPHLQVAPSLLWITIGIFLSIAFSAST